MKIELCKILALKFIYLRDNKLDVKMFKTLSNEYAKMYQRCTMEEQGEICYLIQ